MDFVGGRGDSFKRECAFGGDGDSCLTGNSCGGTVLSVSSCVCASTE